MRKQHPSLLSPLLRLAGVFGLIILLLVGFQLGLVQALLLWGFQTLAGSLTDALRPTP